METLGIQCTKKFPTGSVHVHITEKAHTFDYFTGKFPGSIARGMPFGDNPKTGDARVSGSLASLVGLETALGNNDGQACDDAIKTIVLLHSMIW